MDLWPQEGLTALNSIARYKLCDFVPRKTGFAGFVRFDRSRYSIPPGYEGHSVLMIGHGESRVVIRVHDIIVAEHHVAQKAGDTIMASAALDRLLHRSTVINIRCDSCRLKEKAWPSPSHAAIEMPQTTLTQFGFTLSR